MGESSELVGRTRPGATPPRPRGAPPGFSLAFDRIRCDGRGYCAELLPEKVRLDEWGYPIATPGPVPQHLLDHARRAVSACPMLALRLVEAPSSR